MEMIKHRQLIAAAIILSASTSPVYAEQTDYGREIQSSNVVMSNSKDFTSAEPFAVGLYVLGDENTITQRGNI